jgi:hypothetical protein
MLRRFLAGLALAAGLLIAAPASANTVLSFDQVGGDVVGTISGTLDLPDTPLTYTSNAPLPFVYGLYGIARNGDGTAQAYDLYLVSGPSNFGVLGGGFATASSSDINTMFSLDGTEGRFYVPHGLASAIFSGGMTFLGTTFAQLGLAVGTYNYLFSNGQQFTVQVNALAAVPLPAGALLLVSGLGALAVFRRRRTPGALQA